MLMNIIKTNQMLEIKFGFDDKTSKQLGCPKNWTIKILVRS